MNRRVEKEESSGGKGEYLREAGVPSNAPQHKLTYLTRCVRVVSVAGGRTQECCREGRGEEASSGLRCNHLTHSSALSEPRQPVTAGDPGEAAVGLVGRECGVP